MNRETSNKMHLCERNDITQKDYELVGSTFNSNSIESVGFDTKCI